MIPFTKENNEVLYAKKNPIYLDKEDLKFLKNLSDTNIRKRIRLCCHNTKKDKVHEMIIVHSKECYVRPHFHKFNEESIHIIEGEAYYIIFSKTGEILQIIHLSEFALKKNIFLRINPGTIHSLIIKSKHLVFHEVTNGPFVRNNTIFPDWAPGEEDPESNEFLLKTRKVIEEKFK